MEQQQLESAVFAAGLAAVYNADDWDRMTDLTLPRKTYEDPLPPVELPH